MVKAHCCQSAKPLVLLTYRTSTEIVVPVTFIGQGFVKAQTLCLECILGPQLAPSRTVHTDQSEGVQTIWASESIILRKVHFDYYCNWGCAACKQMSYYTCITLYIGYKTLQQPDWGLPLWC